MNLRLPLLISVAGLLGAYVAVGDRLSGSDPGRGTSADVAMPSAEAPGGTPPGRSQKLNPLEGLTPDSFGAVIERPLFNPGRAPRPIEAPPPAPPAEEAQPPPAPVATGPNPQDFKLLAIASGPSGKVAALRLAASGEVLYLREGSTVDAWTVVTVDDRSLVIGTAEDNITLNLFEDEEAPPPEELPGTQPEASP